MSPRPARLFRRLAPLIATALACNRGPSSPVATGPAVPSSAASSAATTDDATPEPAIVPRGGVSELAPGASLPTAAGQSIYLPIFSQRATRDARFAATVVVRNVDETRPILVTAVRLRDADGRPVRDEIRVPVRLAPRASIDLKLKPWDDGGNASASILVEWASDRPVADPIVEALHDGATGLIIERGRVIEDRLRPAGSPPR